MSCNPIKEYVDFTKKNLKIYTKKIMGKYYDEEVFTNYLNQYINIRYYNQEKWERKDLSNHLNQYLTNIYEKDENKISKFILELFKKYYYIDDVLDFNYEKQLEEYSEMINRIRIEKVGINDPEFLTEFKELINNNEKKRLQFLSLFDSSDFYLDIKETNNKDVYDVNIKENVKIPKIFSDYAIKRVWNETLVAENKVQVEYSMLSELILKNIIGGDFKSNYLVDITDSLFKKEDKLKRTLKIFDNDIGKELITIKVTYNNFLENKELILNYIKDGYKFALILDGRYFSDKPSTAILDMFKYIIVIDKNKLTGEIKDLRNIIIID